MNDDQDLEIWGREPLLTGWTSKLDARRVFSLCLLLDQLQRANCTEGSGWLCLMLEVGKDLVAG